MLLVFIAKSVELQGDEIKLLTIGPHNFITPPPPPPQPGRGGGGGRGGAERTKTKQKSNNKTVLPSSATQSIIMFFSIHQV